MRTAGTAHRLPRWTAPLLGLALTLGLVACDEPQPVTPPQPHPVATVSANPSAAPVSQDPPPLVEGDITVATTNGIQIVVKRVPGAEIAAVQLCIKGGARDWTAADAGIGQLALAVAANGGTATYDKDAFTKKLAALGSDLSADAAPDYASFHASTLLAQFDATFDLLADAFLHPALPANELEIQRSRQISMLRREQDNPDGSLAVLSNDAVFKGHPFQNRPIGTEASVKALGLDAVKGYLGKLRESGRLLVIAVGDLEAAHVVEKVKGAFGALPMGSYAESPFPALKLEKPELQLVERKLATNYIQGVFTAPSWTSPDFPDAMVAMNLLSYRLFEEVRTKRNLSYAPSARFSTGTSIGRGSIYVTAVDPNKTLQVMLDEVKKLQTELVPEKDLEATKSVFLTRYLMENESTAGQAGMLANAILLGGDFRLARSLPERIRGVTPASVQAFAKKYLGRMQMTVLGDATKIDKALFSSM